MLDGLCPACRREVKRQRKVWLSKLHKNVQVNQFNDKYPWAGYSWSELEWSILDLLMRRNGPVNLDDLLMAAYGDVWDLHKRRHGMVQRVSVIRKRLDQIGAPYRIIKRGHHHYDLVARILPIQLVCQPGDCSPE